MKRELLMVATMLAFGGTASAQVVKVPAIVMPARTPAAVTTTTQAMFGCDAAAGKICYFRVFYKLRGDRIVVLPSGMKAKVPGITVGGNYCMTLGSSPVYKCTRKTINQTYNS